MRSTKQTEETVMRPLHPDAIRREAREVVTVFNPEEMVIKNEKHTELCNQVDDTEDEFKTLKAQYAADIKSMKAEARNLRKELKSGKVVRTVNCDVVPEYDKKLINYVDENGVIVDSRRMSPGEQKDLIKEINDLEDDETTVTIRTAVNSF